MSGLVRLLLLALIVLGGGAAAFFYVGAGQAKAPPVRTVDVRVAAQDLMVGTFLDPADAPFEPVAEARVREEHVAAGEADVVGAVVIAPVRQGEPVPRGALLTPGQEGFLAAVLKPGARAVSVGVDAVSGNAGLIFPGDRVDVLLTLQLDGAAAEDDPGLSWGAETILRNVRVIAVDQNLKTDLAERDPGDVARTVTLEVSSAEAERIAVARNLGALSLTLRSLIVEDAAEAAAGETAAEGAAPTWAGDVSAVIRAATGRAAAPAAPATDDAGAGLPAAPAAPRAMRVLRGSASATVGENAP